MPTQHSNSSTMAQQSAAILQLPAKLLLKIALDINDNNPTTWLINLALTHRVFHNIVRETLIRNAVVPPGSIRYFMVLLPKNSR
jgi:hypothetical protein